MPSVDILREARELENVSQRLGLLAEQHPPVTAALLTICGTISSTATILELLVATKMGDPLPI